MIVSRRSFLGLFAAAAASRIAVPAFTPPREPYVVAGEAVSYVGLNLYPAPTFIGSTLVREIGKWDDIGYPVTLYDQGYGNPCSMAHRYYDFDLCNFNRDVPNDFWHDFDRRAKYPNIHAFVREQRFGEPVSKMRERMQVALLDREDRADWPVQYVRPRAA